MHKKTFLSLFGFGLIAILVTSCASKKTVYVPEVQTYAVSSPGENLMALTKVTDSESLCDFPNGGDNGRNIFFVVTDRNVSNIYSKTDPNQGSMNQKTGGKNQHSAPSYCAATNKVAFEGKLEGARNSDIYMVDATQGNALIQVTNTPNENEGSPCLSRDGKKVVYEKLLIGGNNTEKQIWIKDLQTNVTTMLATGIHPSFSPDGRTVVYVKYSNDGLSTCLWTMGLDGNSQTQLTDVSMGHVWRPCFSPNGQQIVFQCAKTDKMDNDLYVINKNGNGLAQLTINNSYDGEPYWSNDGYVYFTSDRGGRDRHYQIWRFQYGTTVNNSLPVVANPQPSVSNSVSHIVKSGETITQIARQYGITVSDLLRWNNLSTMTITPGMKLKVSAQ